MRGLLAAVLQVTPVLRRLRLRQQLVLVAALKLGASLLWLVCCRPAAAPAEHQLHLGLLLVSAHLLEQLRFQAPTLACLHHLQQGVRQRQH